jgi:hypothetical protein
VDPATVANDGLSLQKSQQQLELLVRQASAPVEVEAEVLVLLRPMAEAEDISDAPVADEVEDADLLGQPNGIAKRQHHRGQQDG